MLVTSPSLVLVLSDVVWNEPELAGAAGQGELRLQIVVAGHARAEADLVTILRLS